MTIKIEITGDTPNDVLTSLVGLSSALLGGAPTYEAQPVMMSKAPEPVEMGNGSGQENISTPTISNEVSGTVSTDDSEIDAHGHAWSADLHASTRGKTKEGLWRMKPGATRPDPKPGFPTEDAGSIFTENLGDEESSQSTAVVVETAGSDEDDEFAAFRQAAAKVDQEEVAAVAAVPARKWTDADLGALCNQAAVKLGDPVPVKELIAAYVPEGEVAHSRNIPADKRAEFAAAVEAKAGIEFAG